MTLNGAFYSHEINPRLCLISDESKCFILCEGGKGVTHHLSFTVQTLYSLEEPQSIRTKGNFSLKIIMPNITRALRSLVGFHLLTQITFESLQLPNKNLAVHKECYKMLLFCFVLQNYTGLLGVTFKLCKLRKFQMRNLFAEQLKMSNWLPLVTNYRAISSTFFFFFLMGVVF